MVFDRERARLIGPDLFPRFEAANAPLPLGELTDLRDGEHLLVAERNGERRAFSMREMALHHVAQGELGGEPFALSFCVVCATAVGLTPTLGSHRLGLSAGGWTEGEGLLVDDGTGSYWDPVTGEALHGPLAGERLPVWSLEWTTAGAARRREPSLPVARSGVERWHPKWLFVRYWISRLDRPVRLPPGFRETMSATDDRRPALETGLAVVEGASARFFPLAEIGLGGRENWHGRTLEIVPGEAGAFPGARWAEGGRPFQVLTRWHGFARRWPASTVGGFAATAPRRSPGAARQVIDLSEVVVEFPV